ncbi:SEL1 protein [Nematocida ausubeli]|nr:SEL1 protein [Nematocida ausubeli]KAI5148991.1 SEL1 protein [Nematocida ausubeli]
MLKHVVLGIVLLLSVWGENEKTPELTEPENAQIEAECPHGCTEIFKSIFIQTDMDKAKEEIQKNQGPCKYFYKWFISTYVDFDIRTGVESLWKSLNSTCSTRNLAYLVYATKMHRKQNIIGTEEETAYYYRLVAEEVFKNFFKKRIILFAKWKFSNLQKEGENAKIIKFIKTLKNSGDAGAAENLLSLIRIGHVELEHHVDFLKECARKGSFDAMGILGNMYYYGWGVKPSKITARHYFAEGARGNDPDCLNGLGMISLDEGDIYEGKAYLERASAIGSQEADYNLYKMYAGSNTFIGEVHLMKAAKQDGYLPAVFTYAEKSWKKKEIKKAVISQYKSIAVYHDQVLALEKEAVEMCKKHKNTEAFYLSLLISDLGPKTSCENAMYILKNRIIKIPGKRTFLGRLLTTRTEKNKAPEKVPDEEHPIKEETQDAAATVNNLVQESENEPENSNNGKTKITVESIGKIAGADMLYILLNKRLAESNNSSAAIDLGHAYFHGRGVKKDLGKAFSRYYSSSLMESAEGDYLTGWMYEMGCGVARNYDLAKRFYSQMYEKEESAYVIYWVLMIRVFFKENLAKIISLLVVSASVCLGWVTIPQALVFLNRRKTVSPAAPAVAPST